jgi:hypothetical protein
MNYIAGLIVGYLCPGCQTPQEDLEAELNLITGRSDCTSVGEAFPANTPQDELFFALVEMLVRTYPTPEVMRYKATQLESARKDREARQMVELMRAVADDMESGALWATA